MTLKTFESHGGCQTEQHEGLRLKRLLVPIDFSPASKEAFRYALRFAKKFAAEVTLLYVMAPAPLSAFAELPRGLALPDSDLRSTRKNLRALMDVARKENVKCAGGITRAGAPSHEIVEMAKEAGTDLIVIATHGYTGWKHFCIGSTAERVVRAAPCPVLVVRDKEYQFC